MLKRRLFRYPFARIIFVALLCHWLTLPVFATETAVTRNSGGTATVSFQDEAIQPLPLQVELDEQKVALGHRLFQDSRLSGDNGMACASCHQLNNGGADGRPRSLTLDGSIHEFNTPTVFNATLNYRLMWDGRHKTPQEQIEAVIHDPREMGSDWPVIIARLKQDPDYVSAFAELYPGGIQTDYIKDAIVTFERSLITPNSRFDQFLRGDAKALTDEEKAGFGLFKSYGCVACHQGANMGGNLFQRLGIISDYFADRGTIMKADLGRFNTTGQQLDRHVFRVPSLRNVAITAPYFHDGSAKTLEKAVEIMAKYQLGLILAPGETDQIVKFLHSLTGEYQGRSLASSEGGM